MGGKGKALATAWFSPPLRGGKGRQSLPLDPRTDAELVQAANAGDTAAFETLYLRYRGWVVSLAHRFTRDPELALDVLQDTFAYVLGKFPGFELRSSFKTFLYPAVRNLAIAAESKRRRLGGADLGDPPAAPEDAPAGEALRCLAAMVSELPVGQREVLILRFGDGLSLAEISEALGVPLGTVKSRLHNALQALRGDERTKKYFEP